MTKSEQNTLLQTLAKLDAADVSEITDWGRIAKALQRIRAVAPNVTPEEIDRRAANYRAIMPNIMITSTALASHWGRCAVAPQPSTPSTPHWKMADKLREAIAKHPANPAFVGYVAQQVNDAQKQELAAMKKRLEEMEKNP